MPAKIALGEKRRMKGFEFRKYGFLCWGPKKACDPHLISMNYKDSTYRNTLINVVIAIASRAQKSDTSSVLDWVRWRSSQKTQVVET